MKDAQMTTDIDPVQFGPTTQPEMAVLKMALAWLGYVVGLITLQQVVLFLTGLYTALQIYLLVRDRIIRSKKDCP